VQVSSFVPCPVRTRSGETVGIGRVSILMHTAFLASPPHHVSARGTALAIATPAPPLPPGKAYGIRNSCRDTVGGKSVDEEVPGYDAA
jgi:hypothetical protein